MELTDRVQQSSEVVAREVGGETVLLHLTAGTYFGLNPVGGRIWSLLEGQARTLGEISALLVEEYEVEESEARADVLALASDLCANGLLDSGKGLKFSGAWQAATAGLRACADEGWAAASFLLRDTARANGACGEQVIADQAQAIPESARCPKIGGDALVRRGSREVMADGCLLRRLREGRLDFRRNCKRENRRRLPQIRKAQPPQPRRHRPFAQLLPVPGIESRGLQVNIVAPDQPIGRQYPRISSQIAQLPVLRAVDAIVQEQAHRIGCVARRGTGAAGALARRRNGPPARTG